MAKTRKKNGKPATGISEQDNERFLAIINTKLSPEQEELIRNPGHCFAKQQNILAVHWHPEYVPMDLIKERISRLYPKASEELIIPTQHNRLNAYGDYYGVEVDCYSYGFKRKVQLLIHLHRDKLEKTGVLKSALEHTFRYRASQFFDLLRAIVKPDHERVEAAARETGVDSEVIALVREQMKKLEELIEHHYDQIHPDMIKNRLARKFLESLGDGTDSIENKKLALGLIFFRHMKNESKANFPPEYFYRTSEIIEEARNIGAGVVIPHPEEFWPILLAEYDVDGYEVWNPQSQEYTEFLISVLVNKNRRRQQRERPLLVFMGDDTHMSCKLVPPEQQGNKARREIGHQPPWGDLHLRKKLIMSGMGKPEVIAEYRARLNS